MTSLTSPDLLDERNGLASKAEVQDHPDGDDGKDDEPQKQSPHLAAIAARRGRRSHENARSRGVVGGLVFAPPSPGDGAGARVCDPPKLSFGNILRHRCLCHSGTKTT